MDSPVNTMKRDRDSLEWGREDEPLSKRINSLHLDPNGAIACAYPLMNMNGHGPLHNGLFLPGTLGHQNHSVTQQHQQLSHSSTNVSQHHMPSPDQMNVNSVMDVDNNKADLMQQSHGFIEQQCLHGASQSASMEGSQFISHMQANHEAMIESRDLPESLSVQYPCLNPTSNPHYFSANRVLHELHLDRLKRSGKI